MPRRPKTYDRPGYRAKDKGHPAVARVKVNRAYLEQQAAEIAAVDVPEEDCEHWSYGRRPD